VSKADYKSLFDKSKKTSQKYLLVLSKPNQKFHARLGLVVGKRAVNSAVIRNRIKRVIRNSFSQNQEFLKGLDVVVIAREQCGKLSKQTLREGIDQLWKKLLTTVS
jgi:ribonuclease P protein component